VPANDLSVCYGFRPSDPSALVPPCTSSYAQSNYALIENVWLGMSGGRVERHRLRVIRPRIDHLPIGLQDGSRVGRG
jgi:hypothetical protein